MLPLVALFALVANLLAPGAVLAQTAQTIDFTLPADGTVGDRVALEGSASSGLRVHYHAETPGTCSIDGDGLLLEDAGTCTVTASQAGDDTYAPAADVSASIEVAAPPPPEPAAQTIDFTLPADGTVGDRVALEGSASSGLRVHYHAETPGTCSIDGDGLLLEDAGTCTVTASQAGDDTYAPAADVSASIEVAAPPPPEPVDQTIDFTLPADGTVGDRVALEGSASSGLRVHYHAETPGTCSIDGDGLLLEDAGTCTVTASQAGDDTYAPAADVSASIEVAAPPPPEPVAQTIDFTLPADGTVGDRVALEGSASSGLRVHYHAETPGTCSIDGDGLLLEDAGTCTVTASQAGDETLRPGSRRERLHRGGRPAAARAGRPDHRLHPARRRHRRRPRRARGQRQLGPPGALPRGDPRHLLHRWRRPAARGRRHLHRDRLPGG